MIIDMRLRPPTESWISKPQFVQGSPFYPTRIGFPRPQSAEKRSLPLLLKEMDEAGITYGVSMGRQSAEPLGCIPNEEMGTASRKIRTASSALPASTFAAAPTNALPKLNAAFPGAVSSACRSSLVPRTLPWRPTIVGLYPIYEACALRDVPVSVSLSGLLSTMVGASVEYSSPLPLYRVARDFPKLAIIISHAPPGSWDADGPKFSARMARTSFNGEGVPELSGFHGRLRSLVHWFDPTRTPSTCFKWIAEILRFSRRWEKPRAATTRCYTSTSLPRKYQTRGP
jgi:predicted TIM-barrel fold metal-dependent hydrolase